MKTWMTYGYNKIVADMPAPSVLKKEFALCLTKGGNGNCQIVVNSDADTTVALKAVSCDGVKCDVFTADHTLTINAHQYTDPIIPYSGDAITVKEGLSLPFFLDFKAEDAGDYTATFELTENGNTEIFTVSIHVWSFSLPENKTFATACGIGSDRASRYDKSEDAHKKYYDFLLEHGMCGYELPYDILDPRADEYMSDPRVTSFIVPSGNDEKTRAYAEKIKSNTVWLSKALFYSIDEPHSLELIETFKQKVSHLKEIAPEIPSIVPVYTNLKVGEGKDQFDDMAPYLDLWCPKLCLWDDCQSYAPFLDYTPEKSFETRINEVMEKGQKVWSYVCNDPITPYSQMYIDTDGLMQRLLMWQHYQRKIIGFLYWSVVCWVNNGEKTAWEEPYNGIGDGQGRPVYGCGYLVYPGQPVGYDGIVATQRLKILRDGLNDVELLNMAEKLFGRDWVMAKVNEATPTLTTYTTYERFDKIRKEIGDAIEAATK